MRHILLFLALKFFLLNFAYGNSHFGPISPNQWSANTNATPVCTCASTASLYGDEIQLGVNHPLNQNPSFATVVASNGEEINNGGMILDLQEKHILLKFTSPHGLPATPGMTLIFKDINPQTSGNCSDNIEIIDIKATTSNISANPWLNGNVSFTGDEIKITIFPPNLNSGTYVWPPNSWIKIELIFNCVKKSKMGTTWGFAGRSDIWPNGTAQGCSPGTVRLACETYPVNSPQSNHCGMQYPNTSQWQTPTVDDGTRKCNPINGDTACSEEKHVLCIAESNNPYYNRLPPYNNSHDSSTGQPLGQSNYWPSNKPFPYDRPRYKVHAAAIPGGQPAEYSEGWIDQFVKLSRKKISGQSLTDNGGAVAGDEACGTGWRMASIDDGQWVQGMGLSTAYGNAWPPASPKQSGGWAFHASLAPDANLGWGHPGDSGMNAWWRFVSQRYWIKSNQGGNCWD